MSVPLDREWPGRPTRRAFLAPRGLRERLALLVGPSLIKRYDFELSAETSRADEGWKSAVEARNVLRERTGRGMWPRDVHYQESSPKEGA